MSATEIKFTWEGPHARAIFLGSRFEIRRRGDGKFAFTSDRLSLLRQPMTATNRLEAEREAFRVIRHVAKRLNDKEVLRALGGD